jgi:hypothetical protein
VLRESSVPLWSSQTTIPPQPQTQPNLSGSQMWGMLLYKLSLLLVTLFFLSTWANSRHLLRLWHVTSFVTSSPPLPQASCSTRLWNTQSSLSSLRAIKSFFLVHHLNTTLSWLNINWGNE